MILGLNIETKIISILGVNNGERELEIFEELEEMRLRSIDLINKHFNHNIDSYVIIYFDSKLNDPYYVNNANDQIINWLANLDIIGIVAKDMTKRFFEIIKENL